MSGYTFEFTAAAAKEIRKLDPTIRLRLLRGIAELETEPRPDGCKKLTGEDAWRIRVGDYHVLYEVFDDRLLEPVVRAAHRREVYR